MKHKLLTYFKGDKVIWRIIVALMMISILSVYSSISLLAFQKMDGNTTYYLIKHTIIVLISLGIIYFFHNIDYKVYYKLAKLIVLVSVPLLILTFYSNDDRAALRWLEIPGIGLSFQPSDFAKFALLIFVARILSKNQKNIADYKKVLFPILIVTGAICFLILIANFSTAALLFFYVYALIFVGRVPLKQIFLLTAGIIIFGFILLMLIINVPGMFPRGETWKNRLHSKYTVFIESVDFVSTYNVGNGELLETKEQVVDNYQALQAKIAVANGGIVGKGPGRSTQRDMLPQAYCDFIYAIVIEDYGLIGGLVVLALYLWLLFRAGVLVRKSEYTFPALLSFGLIFMIVFQAMINMAVSVNLFPVTGQTMPLISMGGTSMFFTSISFGIILNISKNLEIDAQKKKDEMQRSKTEDIQEDKNDDDDGSSAGADVVNDDTATIEDNNSSNENT